MANLQVRIFLLQLRMEIKETKGDNTEENTINIVLTHIYVVYGMWQVLL